MTDVPDIPIPDEFEPTHTIDHMQVQKVATVGDRTVYRFSGVKSVFLAESGRLTPLPPPLPKLRDGWYVVGDQGGLGWCRTLNDAWRLVNEIDHIVGVVWFDAATRTVHHVDRIGNKVET